VSQLLKNSKIARICLGSNGTKEHELRNCESIEAEIPLILANFKLSKGKFLRRKRYKSFVLTISIKGIIHTRNEKRR